MVRINSTFKDRRIRAENITIGDTVRWTEKYDDLTQSKVGVVHRVTYAESGTKFFWTEKEKLIGTIVRGIPSKAVITLLKPAPENEAQPLESFQKLLDIASRKIVE